MGAHFLARTTRETRRPLVPRLSAAHWFGNGLGPHAYRTMFSNQAFLNRDGERGEGADVYF